MVPWALQFHLDCLVTNMMLCHQHSRSSELHECRPFVCNTIQPSPFWNGRTVSRLIIGEGCTEVIWEIMFAAFSYRGVCFSKIVVGEDLIIKSCCQGDKFVRSMALRRVCQNTGAFLSRFHHYFCVTLATHTPQKPQHHNQVNTYYNTHSSCLCQNDS